ncbi:MAG: sigma-70 family RNA polymerase sigma factor, partial [Ruthenibacterium sp.]
MPNLTTEKFSAMVQQYERLVYTICYQFVKDHALAEDLAQETFLAAYTHRDDCPPDSYKPWLARIATNKAKDYLKCAYRRHVTATEDDEMPTVSYALGAPPQPEDITIDKDETNAIRTMILSLKEPYLKVSTLFFLQQRSVEEIAALLERPPKTVHTQLYRAKIMLQQQIEGRTR